MENWTNNMKHFLIITNAFKDKNLKLTNEIKGYIKKKVAAASALRVPETMQNMQRLRRMQLRRRRSVCLF